MTIAVTIATITENDLQTLCSQLVHREVGHTVSNLIHTLAQSYGGRVEDRDLADLTEQAYELARSIEDWQSAAEEAGWTKVGEQFHRALGEDDDLPPEHDLEATPVEIAFYADWEELCHGEDIEPQQMDVYEHWLVSDWMAEKLRAEGERVDDDFAGLTVWARTTTGQAISMDYVIRQITMKLHDVKEAE